jgi:hypothetical protein
MNTLTATSENKKFLETLKINKENAINELCEANNVGDKEDAVRRIISAQKQIKEIVLKDLPKLIDVILCEGLMYMSSYGFRINVNSADYQSARKQIEKENIDKGRFVSLCREDVWLRVLENGGAIEFIDREGDDSVKFTLALAKQNYIAKLSELHKHIKEIKLESYDVTHTDYVAQVLIFGEYRYA